MIHITDAVHAGSIESSINEAVRHNLVAATDMTSEATALAAIETNKAKLHITDRNRALTAKRAVELAPDLLAISGLYTGGSVKQKETATVVGTIGAGGAGNAAVVITSNLLPGGSKTLAVAVANNDSAATVAGKIRAAIIADSVLNALFATTGASADVILETLIAHENDSTFNISIANGTCTGLTAAPTSANTTAGVQIVEKIQNNVDGKWNPGFSIAA